MYHPKKIRLARDPWLGADIPAVTDMDGT
jgi:hypothetical protein